MDSPFFKKIEYRGLKNLYDLSPRNALQSNSFNTSDVETVRIKKDHFIVTSTDSLAIEIHSGLYKLPETWGFLSIANSVSDLAASGAKPIGLLVSAQWKKTHSAAVKEKVYRTMAMAMRHFQMPLLGGDSGTSNETVLSTTVIGQSSVKPLSRQGVKPEDLIIGFGDFFGWGPALAYDFLRSNSENRLEKRFRPNPQWQVIFKFRKYFNASIDTSDGVFNSLETLSILNDLCLEIHTEGLFLNEKMDLFQKTYQLPIEYFIESDLGDLQTLVAISPKNYSAIKNLLPKHQLFAIAKKHQSKGNVIYNKPERRKRFYLPHLLEKTNLNYSRALRLWLKQFPSFEDP